MTGEITLRGRVLPIGGLKSKILAAHLAGAKIVILPRKNEKDLRDIPDEIRKSIKLVLVDYDGPGPRGGPSAQAEGARRRAAEDRQGQRPARSRAGQAADRPPLATSRRPTSRRSSSEARSAEALPSGKRPDPARRVWSTRTTTRSSACRGPRPRPRSRRPSASSPASIIPDAKPGDAAAERRFKEINEANEVLVRSRQAQAVRRARRELGGRSAGRGRPGRPAPGRRSRLRRAGPAATSATSSGRPATPASSPTSSGCSSARTPDGRPARRRRPAAASRPTGGPGFEDILAGMGLDGRGRRRRPPAGPAGPPAPAPARPRGARPRSPSRRPSTARPGSSRSTASGSR